MSILTILVNYNGRWTNSKYTNCESKLLLVSDKITLEELQNKVYKIVNVDRNEYDIIIKVIYDAMKTAWPAEITDDDDVRAFIFENLSKSWKIPLCITLERKVSSHGIGNNQDAPPVDFEQDQCPMGTQAHDFGENEQFTDLNNNIGNEELEDTEYQVENHTVDQLDGLHSDDMQFEEHLGSDDYVFQDNVGFNDVPMPPTNVQSDEPNSGQSKARKKGKDIAYDSNITDLCNSSGDIGIGDLYETKKDLKSKLGMDAMKKNYEFKVKRSSIDRFEVVCIDDQCLWKLSASKVRQSSFFQVRKYISTHSCSLDVIHGHHRQASSSLIGKCIKPKYEGSVSRVHRPHDIIDDIRKDMGVNISYVKAWRAREHALELVRGSPEESYAMLPSYFAMLEAKNPGTVTHIETDGNSRFMYCFMALGPCIRGFHSVMRPVIAVDGTFLKSKYLGTLFVATCLDGNNHIYPLAFGVGDSENDASWNWFLTKLRGAIGDVNNLVFVSDRHGSIGKAVSTVFPDAHHGACIFHIAQNIRSTFHHENAHSLYYKAAKEYRVSEFNRLMVEIYKVDSEVGNYLVGAGVERWTRAHFNGMRYNIMTTNIAECLNAITGDARKLPITNFLEYLRMNILQKWFYERRTKASKINTQLTDWAEKLVRDNNSKGLTYQIFPIERLSFNVHDGTRMEVVNLEEKSCTCRQFDLDQLPCSHACAVCRLRHISCYSMCSQYYSANALVVAYAEPIWPVGDKKDWMVPDDIRHRIVLPPATRRKYGRRKEKRLPSRGEVSTTRKCSRCGLTGHYRQRCTNPVALHPAL